MTEQELHEFITSNYGKENERLLHISRRDGIHPRHLPHRPRQRHQSLRHLPHQRHDTRHLRRHAVWYVGGGN